MDLNLLLKNENKAYNNTKIENLDAEIQKSLKRSKEIDDILSMSKRVI